MIRQLLLLSLIAVVLCACKKEEETATVTFWANCGGCEITYTINGTTLGTDSVGGPTVRRTHPAVVGDEATITARPRVVTGSGMGIAILVNDRQQAFTFMRPNSEALLDSTIELRITVPALDRFGDLK